MAKLQMLDTLTKLEQDRGILPYMVLESPGITLYGHWATPLVMEYNYRAREYFIITYIKYLNYSDSLSVH